MPHRVSLLTCHNCFLSRFLRMSQLFRILTRVFMTLPCCQLTLLVFPLLFLCRYRSTYTPAPLRSTCKACMPRRPCQQRRPRPPPRLHLVVASPASRQLGLC